LSYKNNISFNFDIVYVLCEVDNECSIDNNIFKNTVSAKDISTVINAAQDISKEALGYDLEYDKNYYLYVYASADYYETPNKIVKREVLLNRTSRNVKLKKLMEPSFVVTRNASVDELGYFIDFDIVVNDPDRTLIGNAKKGTAKGKYFIKLLDSDGSLVGNMQLLGEDGTYYDVPNYGDYEFDALVVNKKVRIRGLKPNQKYSFIVYSDAFLNNYDENTKPEDRIVEIAKPYTVYSTNDYGVAFGNDITYSATEKSIVVTFLGGSNFDNVVSVGYTIGLWDDESNASTTSGTFIIGENDKRFELYRGAEDWRFVIDPAGMKNTLGKTYTVTISFDVKVPGTDQIITLTSADIPGFEGKAIYVEDE